MRTRSALAFVATFACLLGGCFLLGSGSQAGSPEEPGVQCPERPEARCRADEVICYVMDRTIGCSYRQCVAPGACATD